ncbi:dihydrolipoyl dehydrogenase [Komagataeibacter intermedius]|uniref:Dihydrolipoyl dehydrogenase n=2 Tax=Komagataeibacter intermedius TaxID=66229 RepID=A0A0N1FC46_9PROT|nr:dihydrolipoyl dehydrogenase [Komagataeibacter intermedius]KPH87780.1 dihydrolipoamide dehydrogenase [Komagataeibacter intermedius AF2]MCF3635994.1 dihydrolipoyl dehydrogenase [Komagataeibacter intermedius]GAN85681.1 dihydrolipoamide dehydrogenase [Komagataeibacter intermedius TF2]GBQ70734.1 dihydrolipoamide dehydrogenase [Komagataeibacter intermedius NRIC 0521]
MSTTQFDVIVIGGGPGGYVAAIRAGQLGLKVAVVEAAQLGGICLNWGCIPTKALLRASEINHMLHNLDEFGFAADNVRFDFARVVKRSRDVSAQLSAGVAHLLKKHKVTVINGFGRLAGTAGGQRKVSVSVDGKETATLTAPGVIVATGARARVLPGLEPDGKLVWSYREAMVPTELPRSLLVIGSGAIGVEFASFYRNMGAEVTIVEVADRILPVEDAEISAFARKALEKQGMKILTGAKLGAIRKGDSSVTIDVTVGGKTRQVTVERVISAVGIVGNVENIGLEGTAIEVDRTHIKVDPYCRTGEKGVYAIGDIAGAPWLAHKASHEGVMVAEQIAGRSVHPINPLNIPGCTYCRPQVASVGMTEERAKAAGHKLRVGRFPFIGNGKAIAMGEPEGMVKTIFDDATGELLGAHMVGPEVTEMIQGYVIARTGELTDAELKETIFPHPTISETMHEAVLAAYDGALHI